MRLRRDAHREGVALALAIRRGVRLRNTIAPREAQRSDASSVWNSIRHMLHTRKRYRAFGWGRLEWLDNNEHRVAAYRRVFREENILAIHNLSESAFVFQMELDRPCTLEDLLTGRKYVSDGRSLHLELAPYDYLWLLGN